jgi:hypothetical protein
MTFTDALATGFTLILFVFMVLSLYDQVNVELFQQYKAVVFAGSMFLFLAILGLPYIEYDVAHRVPSFDFISMTIGILAISCALFMYVFNMSFDTFVAAVSCVVIFFTVISRVGGSSEGDDRFPAFAKELLQFILVGSVITGTYMGASAAIERGIPANPTLRGILAVYTGVAPIGLWGMLVYAIYRAIRGLLDYRLANLAPKPTGPYAPFEGFQGLQSDVVAPKEDEEPQLLKDMDAAIDRAQDLLEQLVEQTDSTCAIIKEVEQGYIGARSSPEDEAEYQLPKEEQGKRRQSRQERAMKAFATNRKIYAATRNVQPLECFQNLNQNQNTTTDATEYEVSLRELCIQLHSMLENAETLAHIKKVQSMEVELEYADRMLNKAEGFQNRMGPSSTMREPTPTPTPTPTQIYSSLRGEALDSAARGLLQKELNLYNSVTQIQKKITDVRSRMGRSYQKVNMVATGNYNVTEKDLIQ